MTGNTKMRAKISSFLSNRLIKFRKFKKLFSSERITLFLMISIIPSFAYAYNGSDSDMAVKILQSICSYLSNTIAQVVGGLAIIFFGFRVAKGRMDWHRGLEIALGIGIVMGAGYYGNKFFGG